MSCGVGHRRSSDPKLLWLWAGSYSSNWTPSLGTSICRGCGPKKTKRKSIREKNRKQRIIRHLMELCFLSSTGSVYYLKTFSLLICSHIHFPRPRTKGKNAYFSLSKVVGGKVKKPGKRGRKPAKIDLKAKLERSRQSARECRARKKLRYQYLEELVSSRERAICALREELEMVRKSVNKCAKQST